MTALDAIRARDAALIEENGYLFPPGEDYDSEPWRDRRALLAEVDRLTEVVAHIGRVKRDVLLTQRDIGAEDERARIAAEVLAEPTLELATGVYVDLASVLEDIEGADR